MSTDTALPALRAAISALLRAEGCDDAASVLERSELELVGPDQKWQVGERTVSAHTLACIVSPEDYVALRHRGDLFDRLQRAAERAMESPDTALAALKLLVRLPAVAEPWGRVYRDAPRRLRPEPSSPTAVLEAAHRLLTARGLPHLSEMLGRARLDQAELPSSSGRLSKYVVLLEPEDLAALDRDATGQEAIRQAIADTASRALDAVASVELRARVG